MPCAEDGGSTAPGGVGAAVSGYLDVILAMWASLGSTILQRSSPGPVICHCGDKGLMAREPVTDRHECPDDGN